MVGTKEPVLSEEQMDKERRHPWIFTDLVLVEVFIPKW